MNRNYYFVSFLIIIGTLHTLQAQSEKKVYKGINAVSVELIQEYVDNLCDLKYRGRKAGSKEYLKSADYVVSKLKSYGVKPAVNGSWHQYFDLPYTEILNSGELNLFSINKSDTIKTQIRFPDDFYPGASSSSGKITAPLIYVGTGISAPEMNYDDYENVDVKGKIVAVETFPIGPSDGEYGYKQWQYYNNSDNKIETAIKKGAVGLIFLNKMANTSIKFREGFIYCHCDPKAIDSLFPSIGREYIISNIRNSMKPFSFETGKNVSITASTTHYPDSYCCNIAGLIKGSDPQAGTIILGAHLDGVGYVGEYIKGAFDNASGCADLLAIAKAYSASGLKPKTSILFLFFGAEEAGLIGSRYYVDHPLIPKEDVLGMFNFDMVGNGKDLALWWCESYPDLLQPFIDANNKYIDKKLLYSKAADNGARANIDMMIFHRAGYPAVNVQIENERRPYFYHRIGDDPSTLTYNSMVDLVRLFFTAILQFK